MSLVLPGRVAPPRIITADDAANVAASNEQFKTLISSSESAFISYIWGYDLEDFHVEMVRFWRTYPFTLTLLPAGHGKSTMTRCIIVMEIAVNPNNRLAVVRKSDDDCKGPAGEVLRMFSNPALGEKDTPRTRLHNMFGPFQPKGRSAKWDTFMLNVSQRQIEDESFTLRWFGAGGTMLGYRTFRTFMDDVVTEKNSETAVQREKLSGWYGKSVETGPDPLWGIREDKTIDVPERYTWTPPHYVANPNEPSKMVLAPVSYPAINVTGTPFDLNDLYLGRLVKDKRYKVLHYDVWRDEAQTKPLWVKKWTKEKLDAIRDADERDFNCRYRCIPVSESDLIFSRNMIRGGISQNVVYKGNLGNGVCKPKYSFGEIDPAWLLVLAFDPASGKLTTRTTWPSWGLYGYDRETKERYLIDCFRKKGITYTDIKRCFFEGNAATGVPGFWEMYHYHYAIIETNALQHYFSTDEDLQRDFSKRNIRFERHDTGRVGTQKWDPVDGVKARVQPEWQNAMYNIPYALASDQARSAEFIRQVGAFPLGIHDYVMTMWFFECAIRDMVDRVISAHVEPEYEEDVVWTDLPGGTAKRTGPLHKPPGGVWL